MRADHGEGASACRHRGSLGWALRVGAYSTKRLSSTDFNRYSLVVVNWDDSASTTWNPVPVTATIEFRGMQATYTFPVGKRCEYLDDSAPVDTHELQTTLWWFAAPNAQGLVTGFNATTVPMNVTSSANATASTKSSSTSSGKFSSASTPVQSTSTHASFTASAHDSTSASAAFSSGSTVPSSAARPGPATNIITTAPAVTTRSASSTLSSVHVSVTFNATAAGVTASPAIVHSIAHNTTSTSLSPSASHNNTTPRRNSTSILNTATTGRTH
ncbi:Glycoside hydrolase family 30 protein [Mycena venus]|uniref:Glycoside hydrolase family 30 protein n=1 Tax=Mycena venus TaxID=2733690 RepID=A0A8H6YKR5_9AGAR|nr:Glycoside hydrolase family 30 protein [Mycena venus]